MNTLGNGAPAVGAAEVAPRQKQFEPAMMDGLSSSKVTVEYHDPSGLFPLVQEQLVARLPLKNLHWKASTRPLRSIDSLHVDLVPSADTASQAEIAASTPTSTTTDQGKGVSKERRHQIPGLRQTPYLKVYILRCDDSDTYKSTARKQVREWVKTHTPPSQSSSSASKQENHDAFEWMIVHVVLPDTPAASQPRGSATSASGEKEKSNLASRFTKGTTTLLEKLRADFDTTSKSAPERVAQVRLPKDSVPPHMLPQTPVTSPPITEGPQEQERAWNDIIVKFKQLILRSFDLRVGQYEDDIREKDSQRSLPGWNFCTFFILKEGLARGFESVGLVEDALLGYDELSIGLDTVIREQAMEGSTAQGGVISDHSDDLYDQASALLELSHNGANKENEQPPQFHDDSPINANKKDYRGQILSNKISIFDFRTYIFARQMSLLLRLGNSQSVRSDLAAKLQPRIGASVPQRSVDDSNVGMKTESSSADAEDLFSLAELCSRALNFITFAGRLLRTDLLNGAKAHETTFPEQFLDNLVRSWTFSALEQILRETTTYSLPFTRFFSEAGNRSSSKTLPFGKNAKEQKIAMSEPKSMIHPSRSSSLNHGRPQSVDTPYAQAPSSAQTIFENGQYQDRSTPHQEGSLPQIKNGQQELAGARAQLLAIQRRILERVGKALGWNVGWAAVLATVEPKEEFNNVDLDDQNSASNEKDSSDEEDAQPEEPISEESIAGLAAPALRNAASGLDRFRQSYEALSDLIVKHYMAAGQTKAGESVLGDLAALRFELGDFAAAAMYFGRMASTFGESGWNTVETTMLKVYARCLKKLNRKDEFVRTLLEVLAKSAASKRSMRAHKSGASSTEAFQTPKDWFNDDQVNTAGIFSELVDYSQQLPYDVNVQMAKYFNDIVVEPYVRHFDGKDGFQLRLQFRNLLEDEVEFDMAKIRLIDAVSAQGKDIWLQSTEAAHVAKGVCRVWLSSNVNTTGAYIVDKIILQTKRIAFVHEPFTKAEATTPLGIITSVSATSLKSAKKNRVLCFPRTEAFEAWLFLSHFIHIDKPRHIEVTCSSGWNEIQRTEIRLKSASAGLRLRTANATTTSGDAQIVEKPSPGVLRTGGLAANSTVTFQIPYETETMLPDLTIKMEIDYYTENGQFQYHSSFTIPVELPLDVNVHDHFKNASLFSKFNIKTASQVPLEITDVSLEGSDEYDVVAPKKTEGPFQVFSKQPVAVTYKVTKKGVEASGRRKSQVTNNGSLALSVEYRCLDEEVIDRTRAFFGSAVENGPVRRLARLLINTFTERLRHRVLPPQFERVALLQQVDMGSFEDMGWEECIESLPQTVREDTRSWLQKWHQNHKSVLLPKTTDSEPTVPGAAPPSPNPSRRMIITVSIPQTHILHTASLSLASADSSSSHGSTIAVVGQPLMAELSIKHTRRWCTQSSLLSAANLSKPDDAIDFIYTLEANPDTWLVAGQRRAHFTAKEDDEQQFSVMLIPLRPGTALVPNVEIRAKIAPKSEDDKKKDGTGEEEALNCETDYLTYGECVVVVPDVKSSTVGVGDMSSARSAVWLEAESR